VDRLIRNLSRPIPDALLSQFLPEAPCRRPPRGAPFDPTDAIKAAIRKALQPYADACWV
jgi:tagatose-1,6-bisphosphate aldolase non-catalytic subunit AgaZ/GatZ